MRLLIGLAVAASCALGQGTFTDQNFHGWLLYNGDHRVHGKWGVRLEGQWRRHDISDPQQVVFRTGVNYAVNSKLVVTAGYARLHTSPYGDFPAATASNENRIWQQLAWTTRFPNSDLQYQLRVEQRWIASRYQNRVRFQFRWLRNLREPFYVTASDAVYLHVAPLPGPNVFDQNRFYAALGIRLNRYHRLETGYLLQSLLQRSGRVWEVNHTMQIAVYSTLPFGN